MSWMVLTLPFAFQAIVMAIDEGYFHRRRGLPRWERIGHPLDTATVLACFLFVTLVAPSRLAIAVYIALAAVSCIFITKDEPVHSRHCVPAEQWLHALLFVVHPVVLGALALLWPALHVRSFAELPAWLNDRSGPRAFVIGAFIATGCFALYQTLYWNRPWRLFRA